MTFQIMTMYDKCNTIVIQFQCMTKSYQKTILIHSIFSVEYENAIKVSVKTLYVYCRFYHRTRKTILFHLIFCKLTEWILLNKIAFKLFFLDLNYLENLRLNMILKIKMIVFLQFFNSQMYDSYDEASESLRSL